MTRRPRLFAALLLVLAASAASADIRASDTTPSFTAEGFAVPQPGRAFAFPRDHGSHPDFKIEWWYLTGHLYADDGRRFGAQATFFRQSAPDRSTQVYLAHMAVLDVRSGRFVHQERLNREGWDASASTETLDLRNGPWSLRFIDAAAERLRLEGGVRAEASFALDLVPAKPLVFFGTDGVSRKGAEPTAASHYLTYTRLRADGELTWETERLRVRGEFWMDHEISSSQLGADQVGWDWVSVHFDDGRELMMYRLRTRDGGADPYSTLTWIERDGTLRTAEFAWEVLGTWKSPDTGAEYPVRARIRTVDPATGRARTFDIVPLVDAQEITGYLGGIAYWEGACRILDENGRELGSAYMELTGYAEALRL
jgi:predicted secreted hydrolase